MDVYHPRIACVAESTLLYVELVDLYRCHLRSERHLLDELLG